MAAGSTFTGSHWIRSLCVGTLGLPQDRFSNEFGVRKEPFLEKFGGPLPRGNPAIYVFSRFCILRFKDASLRDQNAAKYDLNWSWLASNTVVRRYPRVNSENLKEQASEPQIFELSRGLVDRKSLLQYSTTALL